MMAARLFHGAEYLKTEASKDDVFTPEDFTGEQRQIADTIDQFVRNDVTPRMEEIEHQNFGVSLDLLRKCGDLGLLMIDIPTDYGGLELDKVTSMHASEKMAPTGSFFSTWGVNCSLGSLPLVYYGTHEQKERYLPKIASGAMFCAYCLTEPDAGSDALSVKTTAVLSEDGEHYILNGTKQFISNGSIADLYTVFAKVDRKHFTGFLVERNFAGLSVGAEEKKLGLKGSSTTQVVFENVKVPAGNVLGEIGKGHKIAFNVLNLGRMKVSVGTIGTAKRAIAEGIAYANMRKQFGVPISSFGAIQEKIADMVAATFASESLLYRLAGQIDARLATVPKETADYYEVYQRCIEEYAIECSVAKVFCTEVLAQVVDEVVQIHGGYGFIQEYAAERFYRDERINRIFEGTNEINRIFITTMVLRRISSGEIDLDAEAAKPLERFISVGSGKVGERGFLVTEKRLLRNLKRTFFILIRSAAKKYQDQLKNEQEILMTLSDLVINIFAMESTILRAEKMMPQTSPAKWELLQAAVQVFVSNSAEKCGVSVRKGANYIAGENIILPFGFEMHRFITCHLPGLLQAKRRLAAAAIGLEKYPF
jgi:alkylation response protein AidB-like acyl-CoA dehydrogenase